MNYLFQYTGICLIYLVTACTRNEENHAAHDEENSSTIISGSSGDIVISNQSVVKPKTGEVESEKIFSGIIQEDKRRNREVTVRVSGRIEKLYVRYDYIEIQKNSPVLEIYSPELNTLAEELLLLEKNNSNRSLIETSKKKLSLAGLSEQQIERILSSRDIPKSFTIHSMYGGYIIPQKAESSLSSPTPSLQIGMSSMSPVPQSGTQVESGNIKEGAYVIKGQALFSVNDLQTVWGMIYIDPAINIKIGDSLFVEIADNRLKIPVDFIEPLFEKESTFKRVRITLENKQKRYKVNDIIKANIIANSGKPVLTLPNSSILDLGVRKIVWLKTGSHGGSSLFKAITVKTGKTYNNETEILSGINKDDEVAEAAGFMIDSESLLSQ